MIRTQIQLTPEQARNLKQLAAREGKSVAELIRVGVDAIIKAGGITDQETLRNNAIAAAGRFRGPANLAADHDDYLTAEFDR